MAHMSAPRQPAPFVQQSPGAGVGVSAFAFQGTNAHALLCAPSQEAGRFAQAAALHWQHQEVNVAPPQHPLLRGVAASSLSVTFACALLHPCNTFLWQHVVGGRPLLPATAYLEAMHAALTLLGVQEASLTSVAFKRPCLLDDDNARWLQVRVQLDGGALEVACGSAVHATAWAGLVSKHKAAMCWALLAVEERVCASGVAGVALHASAAAPYAVHPAALDSVLQLAAGCQQPERLPSTPSVPASLAAYSPSGTLKQGFHAVTRTRPAPRGGAASSYRMPGVCALADLVSLPLAAPKQAAAPDTGMYALAWLAEQQDTKLLPTPLLQLVPSNAAAALAAVQCADATGLVGSNLPPDVAGLMRSAGSELGSCALVATGGAPLLMLTVQAVGETDGYGPRPDNSVAVLRRTARPQPLRYQLRPRPRGALQNLVAGAVEEPATLPMLHVQATGINFRDVLNVLVRW